MGLTWRDMASSVALVGVIVVYAGFASGSSLPLVATAWAASATALFLGAGCAVAAASDLHTRPQPRSGVILRKVTTVLGTIALAAGVIGVIGNSFYALKILVMATLLVWLTGTCWHIMSIGSDE